MSNDHVCTTFHGLILRFLRDGMLSSWWQWKMCNFRVRWDMPCLNFTWPLCWTCNQVQMFVTVCSISPAGIQTVGNYFSMCKSLVAWILSRNWGRLKRRKVQTPLLHALLKRTNWNEHQCLTVLPASPLKTHTKHDKLNEQPVPACWCTLCVRSTEAAHFKPLSWSKMQIPLLVSLHLLVSFHFGEV